MTEEEIKKLAEQYVDELFADDDMSDQDNKADKNDALVMCMAFVKHILEKHCIVSKSKLQEIDNIVCGTFSIGNIAVMQSWKYVKRKLFEEEKK